MFPLHNEQAVRSSWSYFNAASHGYDPERAALIKQRIVEAYRNLIGRNPPYERDEEHSPSSFLAEAAGAAGARAALAEAASTKPLTASDGGDLATMAGGRDTLRKAASLAEREAAREAAEEQAREEQIEYADERLRRWPINDMTQVWAAWVAFARAELAGELTPDEVKRIERRIAEAWTEHVDRTTVPPPRTQALLDMMTATAWGNPQRAQDALDAHDEQLSQKFAAALAPADALREQRIARKTEALYGQFVRGLSERLRERGVLAKSSDFESDSVRYVARRIAELDERIDDEVRRCGHDPEEWRRDG
jgi:hypothetical protein